MRARAATAAVLALTPVLLAAAAAGVLIQRDELTRATALVAEEQARTVAREVPDTTTDPGATNTILGGEENLIQVVGVNGTVLQASPDLRGAPALLSPPGPGQHGEGRLDHLVEDEEDTYLAVAVSVSGGGGYVVAARSLESVDAATASTARLFAVGVPILVALMAALSWVLAGRALRPVESLRSRASQITAAGTGARLPDAGTGDEVARLTETLNQMLQRLDTSARSRRQFVADASHELRNPVASIRAVVEVATRTGDWADVSSDVLAETARLERLVAGLLTLARRDNQEAAPGSVLDGEVDLADLVRAELDRPRRLDTHASLDDGCVVRGDSAALASIVANLLDNADRHGRSQITLALTREGGWLNLTVADDGEGIPDHETERVFERFVRLDEARARDSGGAGLGLAIARAVSHDHGGTLTAQNHAEAGARLHLRLPAGTTSTPSA